MGVMVRTMMRVGGKNGINQERPKGKVTSMDGTVQSSEISEDGLRTGPSGQQ